jgi:hypothetical protein
MEELIIKATTNKKDRNRLAAAQKHQITFPFS